MHSRLIAAATLTAVGFASLIMAEPAFAANSGAIGYMSAHQLQRACKAQGGSFGTAKPDYFCALGAEAITCDPRAHECTAVATNDAASTDDESAADDGPPASLIQDQLELENPVSVAPSGGSSSGSMGERGHGRHIPH